MLKGNEIIGMPIVAYDTGERMQSVRDLIFDIEGNLLGFLVKPHLRLGEAQILPRHGVKTIGAEVIIALSKSAVVKVHQVPSIREVLEQDIVIDNTQIVTESGRDLGTITDVYFEKKTGAIAGYEVLGGLFATESFGYSFVPCPPSMKIGREVAFVSNEVMEWMRDRTSSLRGTVASSSEEGTRNRLTSNPIESETPFITIAEDSDPETLIGRRVRYPICTEERDYMAAQGQIITPEVWQRARSQGLETALQAAVNCTKIEQCHWLIPQPNEPLARLERLWLSVTQGVRDWQVSRTHKRQEKQIRDIVGYPVSRTIFDRQDNVILDEGKPITYKAIATAQQRDVIEVLLRSVARYRR